MFYCAYTHIANAFYCGDTCLMIYFSRLLLSNLCISFVVTELVHSHFFFTFALVGGVSYLKFNQIKEFTIYCMRRL